MGRTNKHSRNATRDHVTTMPGHVTTIQNAIINNRTQKVHYIADTHQVYVAVFAGLGEVAQCPEKFDDVIAIFDDELWVELEYIQQLLCYHSSCVCMCACVSVCVSVFETPSHLSLEGGNAE